MSILQIFIWKYAVISSYSQTHSSSLFGLHLVPMHKQAACVNTARYPQHYHQYQHCHYILIIEHLSFLIDITQTTPGPSQNTDYITKGAELLLAMNALCQIKKLRFCPYFTMFKIQCTNCQGKPFEAVLCKGGSTFKRKVLPEYCEQFLVRGVSLPKNGLYYPNTSNLLLQDLNKIKITLNFKQSYIYLTHNHYQNVLPFCCTGESKVFLELLLVASQPGIK